TSAPGLPRFRQADWPGRLLEAESLARHLSADARTRSGRFHLPMNFFAELKRRNVYKVAIAYAVVAWLLVQAASIFLPAFNAPQWAMQIVILVLAVGFPIALAFSWAFEITPEGIVRESEVQTNESITHHTGRKIVALTIVLAVVATGLLIFQFVRPRLTSSSAATISNKSIAVLPFDNLSGDPQNAY